MTIPLILLAIPSVIAGYLIGSMVYGDFFANAIFVLPQHDVLAHHAEDYHGVIGFIKHGVMALPFWLAIAGIGTAYYLYMVRVDLPSKIQPANYKHPQKK